MDLQAGDTHKNKVRKLSRFLCQELLYDYVNGSLDESRRDAVEKFIPTCRETMQELERLRVGVDYARALTSLNVPPPLLDSMRTYEPAWQKTLRKITMWSEQRGWKFVAPLFVLATIVSGIFVWSPWTDSSFTELARVERQTVAVEESAAQLLTNAPPVASASEATAPSAPPAVYAGAVFRATFTVENLAQSAELLRKKIMELEGDMRPKGDKFFDFSLPESKLEDFRTYLSTLGPVRLIKDKRSQEMPEGRIRIILVLKVPPPVEIPLPKEPDEGVKTSSEAAPQTP